MSCGCKALLHKCAVAYSSCFHTLLLHTPHTVTMSTPDIIWFCSHCDSVFGSKRWQCHNCQAVTSFLCVRSSKRSLYSNYNRHVRSCQHCNTNYADTQLQRQHNARANVIRAMRNVHRCKCCMLSHRGLLALYFWQWTRFCT